jgi:ketosteroid isomerase-like protein
VSRQTTLRELYAAFNRRDIEPVLAAMQPDVVWPNGWRGGYVHGRAAVREYWTRQWAEIDPTVTPLRLVEEPDGRLRVTVHTVVRDQTGAPVADHLVEHLYTFVDELVSRMEIDSPAASEPGAA